MRKPRHIKSNKKNTWTNLRTELSQLTTELNISRKDFSQVGIEKWKNIENKVWSEFSTVSNAIWIWEHLRQPSTSMQIDFKYLRFSDFVDPSEYVWVLLDETVNEESKFWIYEGKVSSFDLILNESCWIYEIVIVSKKYEWILIYNHHDILTGTGIMKDRIHNH